MLAMTDKWQRLADQIVRRRGVLGLTQTEVAQRGPVSLDRVQAVEGARGKKYRAGTIAAFERALEWQHGSIEAILAGGEPTLAPKPTDDARGRRRELPPLRPTDDQLNALIEEARDDPILYDALMSVWRLRNASRQLPKSNAASDGEIDTA